VLGLKREYNLATRALALLVLLVMVPMTWKGRLLLGGTGVAALTLWYRNYL
jgi:hypothetical protein